MSGEASNLVTKALTTTDGDLREEALVGLKVEGEARIVLFNEEARGLLDRLGADTTLQ